MENSSPNLLSFLVPYYKNFTKSEQKLAAYISNYPQQAMKQTISEIAEKTNTSEITVSRFCRKAGFSGLQDLKISLSGEIFTPLESVFQDIKVDDSVEYMAKKLFGNICTGLQDTLKILDFSAMEAAAEKINSARKIDIYALGMSSIVAHDMENHLIRLTKSAHSFSDTHMQAISASLLTPEDVLIAISHTGSNIDLLNSVKVAKNSGAPIIVITGYPNSPITKLADIVLSGMGCEVTYRSESTASRLVHLAIADVLYTCIIMKDPDSYIENLKQWRREIAKHRL
ncbi:hypothetical protein P22_2266 [Propionispora sp. 2/2-37]|uniref:MurR/RpiR family transcriptional regulator n=1 Tax=Propionispora sp. 2/2-37 TaxID=1677858 RepID=UPI0006BB778A|nr:MurR/RpiR family transcriptional regulator [Propionispora sp. 2/2-37]CUH96177.1 hypothetical protein P22_2266 [Propionispora sp. 2/2-37]